MRTLQELSCRQKVIKSLLGGEKRQELLDTLTVYMLDAGSNIAETAEVMFVHKNTIKYRINCLRKMLACDIDAMPEAYDLYIAVALGRLTEITR
ncbi:MAG: helix-turn-helix domain-containing protein [Peptostreptococcaceae bacterium]|nr:helix-turn-helix domain-containing protein [Peptostreptococcaceae bacterium]